MKRLFIVLVLCLALMSCGGSDNGKIESVDVIGNIYNGAVTGSISIELTKKAWAAEIISIADHSTLIDIASPERLADILASEWIVSETTVINDGTVALKNLAWEASIEHAFYLTPEVWTCYQCFNYTNGTGCNGVWKVYGGTLIDPQPEPILPDCEGVEPDGGLFCYETFPDGIDCDNPFWKISYELPGDGLFKAGGTISFLPAGESFVGAIGIKNEEIGIRADHYARWIVKDSDGKILAQRDYVFNVTP